MERQKRNISILQYFNVLQLEFLLYELRAKIYPFANEKTKFKEILDFKKNKIDDLSKKNKLKSIFDCEQKRLSIESEFLDVNGVPREMSSRDKYFYYAIKAEFSFDGKDCKLCKYDFKNGTAVISLQNIEHTVELSEIRRIL